MSGSKIKFLKNDVRKQVIVMARIGHCYMCARTGSCGSVKVFYCYEEHIKSTGLRFMPASGLKVLRQEITG